MALFLFFSPSKKVLFPRFKVSVMQPLMAAAGGEEKKRVAAAAARGDDSRPCQ